jgi:hypothetical protein
VFLKQDPQSTNHKKDNELNYIQIGNLLAREKGKLLNEGRYFNTKKTDVE